MTLIVPTVAARDAILGLLATPIIDPDGPTEPVIIGAPNSEAAPGTRSAWAHGVFDHEAVQDFIAAFAQQQGFAVTFLAAGLPADWVQPKLP